MYYLFYFTYILLVLIYVLVFVFVLVFVMIVFVFVFVLISIGIDARRNLRWALTVPLRWRTQRIKRSPFHWPCRFYSRRVITSPDFVPAAYRILRYTQTTPFGCTMTILYFCSVRSNPGAATLRLVITHTWRSVRPQSASRTQSSNVSKRVWRRGLL